jgi:flagellum-specific peptidoglycan hydrolase FlgJ
VASPKEKDKAANTVKPQQDCDAGKTGFFDNVGIYKKMAEELDTDPDFLMALSAHESGWLEPHNAKLKNLFGITAAGGNNLAFKSYEECADYWTKKYKAYVQGAKTMEAFISGLRRAKYNSIDPDYDTSLKKQYKSILKWKWICKTL